MSQTANPTEITLGDIFFGVIGPAVSASLTVADPSAIVSMGGVLAGTTSGAGFRYRINGNPFYGFVIPASTSDTTFPFNVPCVIFIPGGSIIDVEVDSGARFDGWVGLTRKHEVSLRL